MGTDIEKPERNYFELYAESISRTALVGDLLTFTRFGEYKAGRDKYDVPVGTVLVAHMPTLTIGYIKWVEKRPVDHVMGLVADGFVPPKRETLGDLDKDLWERWERDDDDDDDRRRDPWQLTNYLVMSDPETKDLYTFAASSKTGLSSLGELVKAYGQRMRQFPDEYPTVELQCRHYNDQRYGEVRFPGFKVVDWVDGAPYAALLDGVADASPPKPPTVKKPPVTTTPKAVEAPKTMVGTKAPPKPATATRPAAAPKTTPRAKAAVKF
jgi:hypothetical protein